MALSEIQKQKFLEISGTEYTESELKGQFQTQRAYNDKEWEKYSPWFFTFVIEPETGNLICELEHRMTNNRIFGWDIKGKELSDEVKEKYFKPHW